MNENNKNHSEKQTLRDITIAGLNQIWASDALDYNSCTNHQLLRKKHDH